MLVLNENSQIQVTDVKTIQIETYISISMIPEKLATKHSKILTVGFDKKYTWSLHEVCRGVLQYHQANSREGLQLDRRLFYIMFTVHLVMILGK